MTTLRAFLPGGAAALAVACAPALVMGRVHVEDPSTCASVDFEPSGDVLLCGKPFGHWNGRRFESVGADLFALDGDDLVIKGKHTIHLQASEMVAVTESPTPDLRFRITPAGEVVDGTGKHLATIRPAPRDPHVALVAFAALQNGVVLKAVAQVVTLGQRDPCACPKSGR